MTFPSLLLIKAGSTHPDVIRACGDYDAWFLDALEEGRSRITVVDAFEDAPLPDPSGFGGAIISGSPASVRDEAPWMRRVADYALNAAEHGLPVLGVCFGHQLLGEALGGRVEKNPAGFEGGTIQVELTAEGLEDPLFSGLGAQLEVQATHADVLVQPPRAVRLAGNETTSWQAFASGPRLRGVQFHPELRAETLSHLMEARGRNVKVRPTAHGARIMRNWDQHYVGGRP